MYEGNSQSHSATHTHTLTHIIIISTALQPNLRNYLYKYTREELKVCNRTDFSVYFKLIISKRVCSCSNNTKHIRCFLNLYRCQDYTKYTYYTTCRHTHVFANRIWEENALRISEAQLSSYIPISDTRQFIQPI